MRRIAALALSAGLALLPGCNLTYFTIDIPDFGSKSVQGVWLWRLSPQTGAYQRETQFAFGPLQDGVLDYTAIAADGTPPITISTHPGIDPENPARMVLRILYSRGDAPGYYRASTYNSSGDSPLSTEIVPL